MASTVKQKIVGLADLARIVAEVRAAGRRVALCHGVFDLVHPGHIRHLEAARTLADCLVVTLTRDEYVNKGPGRPVFNQRLRAETIAALECVDYVAINRTPTAVEAIETVRPDFYVKGSDYADAARDLTGRIGDEVAAVRSVGGEIRFTDEVTFSSTSLLNSHFSVYPEAAEEYLRGLRRRYRPDDVIGRLKALRPLRVLVVGDTIIDEYHYCQPLGKASKDTYLVARFDSAETFAGGALAAANHLAGFCDRVDLVTCLGGANPREEFVRSRLKPNVRPAFFTQPGVPTVVKRRYLEPVFFQKMFEVCYLDDRPIDPSVEARIADHLAGCLADYDLVVLTDFGHGLVSRGLIDLLCDRAPFLAVNTQTNSANAGYNLITKYPRADYVCIDEPELRLATSDRFSDLPPLIGRIVDRLGCPKMSVTRGARGAVTYAAEDGCFEIPVFSSKVLDTVGAGDAYLSVTAPCVAAGMPMDLVGFVGNAVGALAVQIVGNRTSVEPAQLYKSIVAMLG